MATKTLPNWRKRIATLGEEDRLDLEQSLRAAIFHLANCWDSLRNAEEILQTDDEDYSIETDYIEGATGETIDAADAFKFKLEYILDEMEVSCG